MGYLTKENLDQIRKYLGKEGVKDSSFDEKADLTGSEYMTLVSGGKNWKIKTSILKTIFSGGGATTTGGIQVVDTKSDLDSLTSKGYGNLVYVKDEDQYYSYSNTESWERILKLYIGSVEPVDKTVLWIDMDDNTLIESDQDTQIATMQSAIKALQTNMSEVLTMVTNGIISGDSTTSVRVTLMNSADPEKPAASTSTDTTTTTTTDEGEKPDTGVEPTVSHISIKLDTALNFAKNKANLIDGEILYYIDKGKLVVYYNGSFHKIGTDNSGSGGSGISLDDLYAADLEYLVFTNGNKNYKVKVLSDGNFVIREWDATITKAGNVNSTWGVYVNPLLNINSIYCGGAGSEECLCSHNFVELANSSESDVNLNGLFLLYTDGSVASSGDTGYAWKVLPLKGVIKAGSTFLIRGAQCNTPKASFINVDNYDMEWYDGTSLITFKQGPASFYLAAGDTVSNWVYDSNGNLLATNALRSPWNSAAVNVGYIDSVGFGTGSVGEGSKTFTVLEDWNKLLFMRWFMLEPAKQGNKEYSSRKTTDLWTYINLEKQTMKLGNSIQYYYPDFMKQRFTPRASDQGKNFFTNKTLFNPNKPNIINVTFGIQATVNDAVSPNILASRCFNWVSIGYYDEYLEYKKDTDTTWTRVYSIQDNDDSNSTAIKTFIDHYKRLRWCTSSGLWVTSHKVILSNVLSAGTYEYRVGRDTDESYTSEVKTFTVKNNSDVTSFSFIQVSDQQGFNWMEYQAWKKSAYFIDKTETDYNFLINTGDITQNGNRENEWLDYYEGKQYINDKEEMFTIGNNDLCGHVSTQLTDGNDATSKYSHINILRYFTFELDPNNTYSFTWNSNTYPIYSLYSFNYGAYHFVCLNSEIATASSKMYKDWADSTYAGDSTFAQSANAAIESWFLKDLQTWKGITTTPSGCSKCVVYCHEMPFTMVTWGFMGGSSSRQGSHLNTLNSNGNYRYSRLFKKYGIRLVIGGHKHTYTISKPIYDAPQDYITSSNTINSSVDLMDNVTDALSRVPVIQVTSLSNVVRQDDYARYQVVSKIDAPTYVMSQASGYKLVSNKEQPSGPAYTIPWLLSYFKAKTNADSPTENVAQHYPMYIKYTMTGSNITVTANQISGIWNTNVDKGTKSYDMNVQLTKLAGTKMTLSQISDEDKSVYGITNTESYIITL